MAISLTHTTVAVGTDAGNGEIAKAQWNENHTLTMATARLLGRTTAGAGAVEEISVGTGLSLSGGALTNTVTATSPGGSDTQIQFNDGGSFGGDADFTWDKTNNVLTLGTDLLIRRRSAATLQLGAADAAAPVAQTLAVQSVVAGTTNTAGANLTIAGSRGTGTGAGGSIIFQLAPAGSSGTAQNSLVTFGEMTSARAWNLYNTADVITNYERGFARWQADVFEIGTEAGGSGTVRSVKINSAGKVYDFSPQGLSFAATAATAYHSVIGTNATFVSGVGSNLVFSGALTSDPYEFRTNNTTRITIGSSGGVTIADANDFAFGTTTGSKIGTATSQKLGFWNASPIVQPTTAIAAATVAATGTGDVVAASTTFDGYTIPQIVKALRNAGLLA